MYSIASPQGSTPLVQSAQSLPFFYEGHNVITDIFRAQGLSLDALTGLTAPQYYAEPGYLISFRLAANDENMGVKAFVKGMGDNSYTLADYTFRQMASLGLGMTLGEAEETYFTEEGETSRDLSGRTSDEYPFLVRYKHLPTGTEPDYEMYKGTLDDKYMVMEYTPRQPPKFNTLFFDVYNGNSSGTRLIHELTIKRYIIMDNKISTSNTPDFSKSILNIKTDDLIQNMLATGKADVSNAIAPNTMMEEQVAPLAAANYTLRKKKGVMQKSANPNIFYNSKTGSLYSLNPEQQKKEYLKSVMNTNEEIYGEIMRANNQRISKLKSYGGKIV